MAIPRRRHHYHSPTRFLFPAIFAILFLFFFLLFLAPSPNDDNNHLRHFSGGKGGVNEIGVPTFRFRISRGGVHNRDLWSSRNSKFFYGCSNASSKFAKAKAITHPNRYLLIVTSGGLNQQRTGITDAVVAARILNATLVVPKLDKTSFWKDSSDFSDIFDVDWFIKHLTTDVSIIKDLPLRRGQIWAPYRMRVPRKCNERCYINRVLPVLMKKHAVQISKFDYRLANKLDTDLQKLRCRVNYHALKFADPILEMGEKLVQRMRMSSKHYIALHLRFEPDMLAFSGCYYGGGDKERTELGKIRRRWKTLHSSNPDKARRQGRCPLTPEEVGLMLRGLGYGKDVHIYVASGEVYGGEETLAPLKALFPNFYSKDTIASKEELEPFSAYSSRMAALDFIVCDESDVFVTNNNGNMAKILAGRRRYFGHKPTIRPNAKKLNRVFLNRNNMTREEFSSRVCTFQRGFMGEPKEVRPGRGEFHENPSSCICEDSEAEKKMDWGRQKIGKGNVANKKDRDDMKKDIEAVVHDENVDDEPEMADPEDEDDEDSPPGEVSLSRSQVEASSNGTSTDYDPFMSEETELDELLSD
ncbi:O-fucosyltransferase 16-like isoform X1 [Lycium ferocissimum]|uniref:O-fucosyltransferase 16-like isoform X1 n=1 Tax=Lycium ferocissimum TaxID=112874 RepID=UPI002815A426|nr:O-fucosyltransferase 16-like isoform X1 [Lycium ferocissimum]